MQCVLDTQYVYLYLLYPYLDVCPYSDVCPYLAAPHSFVHVRHFRSESTFYDQSSPLPLDSCQLVRVESLQRARTMKFLAVLGVLLACSSHSEAREGPTL